MDLTGHPERGLRCVHVAGTNGKGSTSHLLASVLQEAGYKVGLHTSPHLKDLRERFRINGEVITQQDVICFVEERSRFRTDPSLVLRVGDCACIVVVPRGEGGHRDHRNRLGGRLDSTNVITPDVLSVIANIGWDHMDFLGNTLRTSPVKRQASSRPGAGRDGASDPLRKYSSRRLSWCATDDRGSNNGTTLP